MKKITTFLYIFCFTAAGIHAQNNWTQADKDDFVNECIKSAKEGLGDSANRYCNCMLKVMMTRYPKVQHMDTLTAQDFNEPGLKAEIKRCLTMRWPETDRTRFIEGCIGTAKESLGVEKAKQYCNCMLGKMEIRFANATDADKLTEEDLKKPEWINLIKGCLK
jgi:hypothetical protein